MRNRKSEICERYLFRWNALLRALRLAIRFAGGEGERRGRAGRFNLRWRIIIVTSRTTQVPGRWGDDDEGTEDGYKSGSMADLLFLTPQATKRRLRFSNWKIMQGIWNRISETSNSSSSNKLTRESQGLQLFLFIVAQRIGKFMWLKSTRSDGVWTEEVKKGNGLETKRERERERQKTGNKKQEATVLKWNVISLFEI